MVTCAGIHHGDNEYKLGDTHMADRDFGSTGNDDNIDSFLRHIKNDEDDNEFFDDSFPGEEDIPGDTYYDEYPDMLDDTNSDVSEDDPSENNDVRHRAHNTSENIDEFVKLADDIHHDNDDEYESVPYDNKLSRGDIDSLVMIASQEEDDDSHTNALRSQLNLNRQNSVKTDAPYDTHLIDDPVPDYGTMREVEDGPGDSANTRHMMFLSIAVIICVIGMIVMSVMMFAFMSKPEPTSLGNTPVTVGQGDPIDDITSGDNSSSDNSDSDSNSGNNDSFSSDDSQSNRMVYEVEAEGDIQAASVSYIGAAGAAQQETGITLPWTKSMKSSKSVSPHMAVSSTGRGTLTCTITKDGEEISTKTASGESPSVECKES